MFYEVLTMFDYMFVYWVMQLIVITSIYILIKHYRYNYLQSHWKPWNYDDQEIKIHAIEKVVQ